MLEDEIHLKDIPSRFWEKMAMAFGVIVFGMLVPLQLTIEATFKPLLQAVAIGVLPTFALFIYLKKRNFWGFKANAPEWSRYLKLFIWALFVSSIFHTPLLLINRLSVSPLEKVAIVRHIQDNYARRTNIFPPHLVLWADGKEFSIRMDRQVLKRFKPGQEILIQGKIGILGYLVEAEPAQ